MQRTSNNCCTSGGVLSVADADGGACGIDKDLLALAGGAVGTLGILDVLLLWELSSDIFNIAFKNALGS